MVRKYVRKSKRAEWTEGQMALALKSAQTGVAVRYAAKANGVPRSTLQRRYSEWQASQNPDNTLEGEPNTGGIEEEQLLRKNLGRYRNVFNEEQELAIVSYILYKEVNLLGFTPTDVRKLVFQFAEKLNIPHNFDRSKGLAGEEWFAEFRKRHNLSLRKSEGTSKARANGFNKEAVDQYFNILEQILVKYNITSERIWNCDESPVSIVPKAPRKVVAKTGRRQVGNLTAAERGETVTAELCFSASGNYMPPLLVFPRVNPKSEYLVGAPEGALAEFHKSGWMQQEIFFRWFKWFCEYTKASKDNRQLLIFDGHSTHIRNLEVIDLALEKGVIIVCLPPHCTHKLQPLDVGFNGPLSTAYGDEVAEWHCKGKKVTLYNVYEIFGIAWQKVCKKETAVNAFKKTGIVPLNRNIFKDSDFVNLDISSGSIGTSTSAETSQCLEILHEIQNPEASQDVCQGQLYRQMSTPIPHQEIQNLLAPQIASDEIGSECSPSFNPQPSCSVQATTSDNSDDLREIRKDVSGLKSELSKLTLLMTEFLHHERNFVNSGEYRPRDATGTSRLRSPPSCTITSSQASSHTPANAVETPREPASIPSIPCIQAGSETQGNVAGLHSTGAIQTSLQTLPNIISKKSQPRGRAFLVTDEIYRDKLAIDKEKKVRKEPKAPKRKTSTPLQDSTNKRPRTTKKSQKSANAQVSNPVIFQNQVPQILSLPGSDNSTPHINDNAFLTPLNHSAFLSPVQIEFIDELQQLNSDEGIVSLIYSNPHDEVMRNAEN